MTTETVYLGIGSNRGDPVGNVKKALQAISDIPKVQLLKASRLYLTSPVSDIPQGDFVNAVCCLQTFLSVEELFSELCTIETRLGKHPKAKNAPRDIDIDILFFGTLFYRSELLDIPHPRWKQRLFVLVPLQELTEMTSCPLDHEGTMEQISLKELISHLEKSSDQRICALQ